MKTAYSTLADVGLRRARMTSAGRMTPAAFQPRSALASVPFVGRLFTSGPGADDGLVDKLTTAITGTALDPATRLGYPPSVPADWAAQPNGDIKYAFYTEGVNAGFVRGTLFGVLAGALATTATHFALMRMRGRK